MCKNTWKYSIQGKNRLFRLLMTFKINIWYCHLYSSANRVPLCFISAQVCFCCIGLFAIILFRWYSMINQKPPDFVHTHRWQFYDTDYHCSSCVTWHTSVFPSCFPSLRMTSWQAAFHWDHSWWGLSEEYVDKWNGEMHLPGHVLGVCWIFFVLFF